MEKALKPCKISVIIITRNRAEALEKISLPSLLNQTFKDFEVIVWDASDNDSSAEVVKRFPQLNIRYFKAPRLGTCSQRNDAVKVTQGEIIYFIDDDSELSPDALEAIYEELSSRELAGCSPPVQEKSPPESRGLKGFALNLFSQVFLLGRMGRRNLVLKSGQTNWSIHDIPGETQILHGNSMAYKRSVFQNLSFDEDMEKLGGWALAEDVMFSFNLSSKGKKLAILEKGGVIHHHVTGVRAEDIRLHAMGVFNRFLIWKKLIFPSNKTTLFHFFLSLKGAFIMGLLLLIVKGKPAPLKGFFLGLREIFTYWKTSQKN